jgi:hypothetical protein
MVFYVPSGKVELLYAFSTYRALQQRAYFYGRRRVLKHGKI